MKFLCTFFDINYLDRGLALIDSLEANSSDFRLYILGLDEQVVEYFKQKQLANIVIVSMEECSEFFNIDETKYANKKEFYFSLTPLFCLYLLKKYQDLIDALLYLDADTYLFNRLQIIYDEIGEASISMCTHRLPWYIKLASSHYGEFNAGLIYFKNDTEGIKCLEDWYHDCSTWKPEQEGYSLSFFSDQIWMDKWPKRYNNIQIIEHIGINTAPWNVSQYKLSFHDNVYYVEDVPLVFYHFSSLKKIDNNTWHGNTAFTILNISGLLYDIYKHYIMNIEKHTLTQNHQIQELKVTGNKLKMFIYRCLKSIHNHEINT
jgi:hypothetical protein